MLVSCGIPQKEWYSPYELDQLEFSKAKFICLKESNQAKALVPTPHYPNYQEPRTAAQRGSEAFRIGFYSGMHNAHVHSVEREVFESCMNAYGFYLRESPQGG